MELGSKGVCPGGDESAGERWGIWENLEGHRIPTCRVQHVRTPDARTSNKPHRLYWKGMNMTQVTYRLLARMLNNGCHKIPFQQQQLPRPSL